MEATSVDSINNDTSVINGLEELVMTDERANKRAQGQVQFPLNRIESERSNLTGSDALIEERPSFDGTDQSCYRPFSILPGEVWDCLKSYYGGGPTIPRLICSLSSRSVLDRDEIRSNKDSAVCSSSNHSNGGLPNDALSSTRREEKGRDRVDSHKDRDRESHGAWIDINPLSLHLFLADCTGNPLVVPGETIAFRSEGMASLICRILLNFLRSSDETSLIFPTSIGDDEADESLALKFLQHCYHDSPPLSQQLSPLSSSSSFSALLGSVLRVWILVYHTALDVSLDESAGNSPMSSRNRSLLSEEPRCAADSSEFSFILSPSPMQGYS
jgi:hypothetical protein